MSVKVVKLAGHARGCATGSSSAGRKLLKAHAGKTIASQSPAVSATGSVAVKLKLVRGHGPAKLSRGKLSLPKGAYRIRITAGTRSASGLIVVR